MKQYTMIRKKYLNVSEGMWFLRTAIIFYLTRTPHFSVLEIARREYVCTRDQIPIPGFDENKMVQQTP